MSQRIIRRTVLGPAHYACYFINGDATGFDDDRDQTQADAWFEANVEPWEVLVDADGEPEFSKAREAWEHTNYTGGMVLEYVILSFEAADLVEETR